MESEVAKLAAAEHRLREVIRRVVKKRTSRDRPLNWRLMFEIEDEAISLLQKDAQVDVHYINMMASPSAQRRLGTEAPAGLTDIHAMHTALWMIQEAYYQNMR